MIERALEKENRLLQKVERIEQHIMSKEMYRYEQIKKKLEAQKQEERRKRAEQERQEEERKRAKEEEEKKEANVSQDAEPSTSEPRLLNGAAASSQASAERTGDPFKDF